MAILPTAHASQRFGGKTIDFYVAPGQVIGSDPRARADERRIQDLDGERHPVRIATRDFALDPGDYAAVIRLQPGPKRRSRPVAVINYRTNSWTRTQGDAPRLLSRAGVARNANWFLTLLAFIALAGVIVWPHLVAMLGIISPALASGLPAFDIFALLAGAQPGLADARLANMAPGLADVLASALPPLAGQEGAAIFALGVAAGLLVAFGARSWRFAWVPVFLVGILAGAIAVSGPEAAMLPALAALGGSAAFFLVGGFINRWRDSVRLEARVARLADHVLRHPPEEMVTRRGAAPALSDEARPAADTAPDEDAPQTAPAAATGTVIAAAGAASIAARSTDGPDTVAQSAEGGAATSADASDDSPEAGQEADTDEAITAAGAAESVDENKADGPDGESAATEGSAPQAAEGTDAPPAPDAAQPDETGADETVPGDKVSGEAASETPDPRLEARSMDIPPPPPMPAASAADAPSSRVDSGGDASADGTPPQEEAALESGDALRPQDLASPADTGSTDGDAEAGDEDDDAGAPDAFGGSEEKRE
ncbi:MAG: hypothetical protein JJU26_10530 [Oceanicaulis sp.]|uniref:hypothetical protein n=1 Tax=Glycocaulis sp. TaxID=1969725 RepID=UPI0025B7EF4D|nr:hypothetical protein [Glycocaulis sp.]MCC5982140.1 hypothetical protein [Oceanicaulis sp.]MCH8520892.1 hypothetical protein [Glycocaulis sp.]